MKPTPSLLVLTLLIGGLAGWLLGRVPLSSNPATPQSPLVLGQTAAVERSASTAGMGRDVTENGLMQQPVVNRAQRLALKEIFQTRIRLWERQHARYENETGAEGQSILVVEIPPADPALLNDLRHAARTHCGGDSGIAMFDGLMEVEFAEIIGPRKIVAVPRSPGGRRDRFEVFIPEPPTDSVQASTAWMMSCSYMMNGNEPPEELRHLLRFGEQ